MWVQALKKTCTLEFLDTMCMILWHFKLYCARDIVHNEIQGLNKVFKISLKLAFKHTFLISNSFVFNIFWEFHTLVTVCIISTPLPPFQFLSCPKSSQIHDLLFIAVFHMHAHIHTYMHIHKHTHIYISTLVLLWTHLGLENLSGDLSLKKMCSCSSSLRSHWLPVILHLEMEHCEIFLHPCWHVNWYCHYASLV